MSQDDLQGPIVCQRCRNNPFFRDPRRSPPPLPSREAILRKLLLVHAPDTDYFRAAIDALTPHDEHNDEPFFPQCMRLPLEVRGMIWLMAVPQRTYDNNPHTLPGGFKTVQFDVDVEDRPAVFKAFSPIQPPQLFAEYGLVTVIVDLNDDQALAEIAALHDKTALSWPVLEMLCLNCLGNIWISSQSLYSKWFWLILHLDELSEVDKLLVFETVKPEIAPYKRGGRRICPRRHEYFQRWHSLSSRRIRPNQLD
ncbi:hypothetical protein BJX68DRAFT_267590 [Aspergillus pseudodeflectus]|uniref:Uncharacterized protein n=1 Tax=Aspergillus pseudodeflectus TaxID=176178 RepID=A0ABR4K900_9EURO